MLKRIFSIVFLVVSVSTIYAATPYYCPESVKLLGTQTQYTANPFLVHGVKFSFDGTASSTGKIILDPGKTYPFVGANAYHEGLCCFYGTSNTFFVMGTVVPSYPAITPFGPNWVDYGSAGLSCGTDASSINSSKECLFTMSN